MLGHVDGRSGRRAGRGRSGKADRAPGAASGRKCAIGTWSRRARGRTARGGASGDRRCRDLRRLASSRRSVECPRRELAERDQDDPQDAWWPTMTGRSQAASTSVVAARADPARRGAARCRDRRAERVGAPGVEGLAERALRPRDRGLEVAVVDLGQALVDRQWRAGASAIACAVSRARDSGLAKRCVDARACGELCRGVARLRAAKRGRARRRRRRSTRGAGALGWPSRTRSGVPRPLRADRLGHDPAPLVVGRMDRLERHLHTQAPRPGAVGSSAVADRAWKLRAACAKASFGSRSDGPSDLELLAGTAPPRDLSASRRTVPALAVDLDDVSTRIATRRGQAHLAEPTPGKRMRIA